MDYRLTIEGLKDFVEVKIYRIDLYFRCNNKECLLVNTVRFDLSDKKKVFEKHFICDCKNEFRMTNKNSRVGCVSFTVYGDFTPSKTSMSDDDVFYRGKSFDHKFFFQTKNDGSWKMDLDEFHHIAPTQLKYSKKEAAAEGPGFGNTSSDEENNANDTESRVLKKLDEVENEVIIDVLVLRPTTVGLCVSVQVIGPTGEIVPTSVEGSRVPTGEFVPDTAEGSRASSCSSEETVEGKKAEVGVKETVEGKKAEAGVTE